MSIARVNGIDLHYDIADFTDPWRKPETILLHHGFARNRLFWYRWVHGFSRDYRVVIFDSRGCGDSVLPGVSNAGAGSSSASHPEFSLDQLSGDALGLLDALNIDRVHWAGEASGGIVGIVTALRAPQRIASLTLSNTPIRLPQTTNDAFVDAEVRAHGTGYWARKTIARRIDVEKVSNEWIEWSIAQHDRTPAEVAIALHRMLESADSWPLLPQLKMPVLVLASESSQIAVRAEMEQMAARIPRGRLSVFSGYGQGIAWMAPERCIDEMKNFLGDVFSGKI